MAQEAMPHGVGGEGGGVPDDQHGAARAGEPHIDAPLVRHEADSAVPAGTHGREDRYLLLPPLHDLKGPACTG